MKEKTITSSGQMRFIRRRYPLRYRLFKGTIGTVPLADIVLLIILFTLMSSWVVLRPGVTLELPESDFVDGVHPGTPIVTITRDQTLLFNDERTSLARLSKQLPALVGEGHAVLVIEADKLVPHDLLVRVYNQAQVAGFDRVLLATQLARGSGTQP